MKCPKCKHTNLSATKLEDGLPVMGCVKCDGVLLTLLYYRDWAERTQTPLQSTETFHCKESEPSDTSTALACPKCSKLMTKYQVNGSSANRLDLCRSCDEAWLDGGEWELLKSLELGLSIPKIFTEEWQKKVRDEKTEAARVDRLAQVVESHDLEKVIEIRQWLKSHPQKKAIVHFLGLE